MSEDTNRGKLFIVGCGPGAQEHLTLRAREVLAGAEVIVGYRTYVDLIRELLAGKTVLDTGMMQEVQRARQAVALAATGKAVAVISGGDSGIYGMAGLVYEVMRERSIEGQSAVPVEVVPGVPAFVAAASLLGAPLMHDFAAISLSDLLTPWELIARRLEAAAAADFVIALYNPRSHRRRDQLAEAQRTIRSHRPGTTPVGIVRAGFRDGQTVAVTDLDHMLDQDVDMVTVLLVGNSTTYTFDGLMVTPRGYGKKYEL